MFAKRFFYVCAGLLCLSLAYHLGARNATAQAPGSPVVGVAPVDVSGTRSDRATAITANGDLYGFSNGGQWGPRGKIFSGPTPAAADSWGDVKARYRK